MCSSLQHRTDDLVVAAVILSTPAGAGARSERPEQMSARRLADAVVGSHQPLPIAKPAPCVPRCGENYWDLARVGANHAVKDAGRTERAKPLRCAVPPGIYWAAAVASERACLTFVVLYCDSNGLLHENEAHGLSTLTKVPGVLPLPSTGSQYVVVYPCYVCQAFASL